VLKDSASGRIKDERKSLEKTAVVEHRSTSASTKGSFRLRQASHKDIAMTDLFGIEKELKE
jgi:hypothetical protein